MCDVMNYYNELNHCPTCKKLKAIEIIKKHKLLNYVLKNPKCASMYHLSEEEIKQLKEITL